MVGELAWPLNPVQGTKVQVRHIFSVEIDPWKRNIILADHSPEHLFSDVACFHTLKGFCYVCQKEHDLHDLDLEVDIFASGPSCKGFSKLNNRRSEDYACYEKDENATQTGTSGPTYIFGFKKAAWQVRDGRVMSR